MAYSQQTVTSHDDLATKMNTFLVANGWTSNELDTVNDEAAWSKGTVFVQIRWDNTDNITIFQSLGFLLTSTPPGGHTDDSGNGDKGAAPHTAERRVQNIGALTTLNTVYFFASGDYFHCVLEFQPGRFRHFGWGLLTKFGTWTGGEYCYGHIWNTDPTAIDAPADNRHSLLLDSNNSAAVNNEAATVHLEGFAGQGVSKWGVVFDGAAGNDEAGNLRVTLHGFTRDGPMINALAWIRGSFNNAMLPLIPIEVYYNRTSPSPDEWYLLGVAPDVKVVNMAGFSPGDEVVVGADTWKLFPWTRKRNLQDNQEESKNGGIAYRKIV